MKKAIVSSSQNIFYDGKQVDHNDLTLEQQFNDVRVGSTIQNIFGNGVINDSLRENILYSGNENYAVTLSGNILDKVEGSQISVSLTNSQAAGNRKVKVLLIGLDFNFNLIYDAIHLVNNDTYVTDKHYTELLMCHTNDISNSTDSLGLLGTLEVKEVPSVFLSKNTISDQNSNPSIFFRDLIFNTSLGSTLEEYLSYYLPNYNIEQLNLQYDSAAFDRVQELQRGDLTTQLGQKFIAKSNNIQKITLLMSVQNVDNPSDLQWDGDLSVSIYPLQSSVSCITDIIPENKLDYHPTAIPLAQISLNYFSLLDKGYLLDEVPQPIDFVFSNSSIANGRNIKVGEAYAIVLKRSGANTAVDLRFNSSENTDQNKQMTVFTGNGWVNVSTESLWYQISSDSAKVSSGQYYNFGQGLVIEKIKYDSSIGANIDFSYAGLDFSNNLIYKAICESKLERSKLEENPRTGDNVNSQKKFVPNIKLLNPTQFNAIDSNENLTIGAIKDTNTKYDNTDADIFNVRSFGTIGNKLFIKVITDTNDSRFDQTVINLKSMIITNEIKKAKIYTSTNKNFRIADAKIHTIQVGNYKNSTMDYKDLDVFALYKDLNLTLAPINGPSSVIDLGSSVSYTPGYEFLTGITAVQPIGVTFILTDSDNNKLGQGTIDISPNDLTGENFSFYNASINIGALIVGNFSPYIYINDASVPNALKGRFLIRNASGTNANVRKALITQSNNAYTKALSFDVDSDQIISFNDGYLLNSYLNKAPYVSYTPVYPGIDVDPYQVINKTYEVIELSIEKYVDRHDDYWYGSNRSLDLHTPSDLFIEDILFQDVSSFIRINFIRQLTWDSSDVICSSDPKSVIGIYSDSQLSNLDKESHIFPNPLEFEKNVNNYFNPGNLLLDGNVLNQDKSYHKLDFEVSDIILEIPEGLDGYEKSLDVFYLFVAEYVYDGVKGLTGKGFPARKFSDGTYVQDTAIDSDQVRFSVAIQSFTPELDGSSIGSSGVIVDGRMGLAISENGLLTVNFTNLYNDPAYVTGNTKIKVSVFLKKAGFSNKTLVVNSNQVFNLLQANT